MKVELRTASPFTRLPPNRISRNVEEPCACRASNRHLPRSGCDDHLCGWQPIGGPYGRSCAGGRIGIPILAHGADDAIPQTGDFGTRPRGIA